jgi:hypothetical protein
MDQIKKEARLAGMLYLLIAVIAPFSLAYVPGEVASMAGTTAAKIRASHDVLTMSVSSVLAYQTVEVFITLALYHAFKGVDKSLALMMLILGLLPLPIVFLNELTMLGAINLATSTPELAAIAPAVRDGLAGFLYELHYQGLSIAGIFWGLWLLPLGTLIIRSIYLPKWLGISVIIGGLGYVLRTLANLTFPAFLAPNTIDALSQIASIMTIGEVPVIVGLLWLGFGGRRLVANAVEKR